MVMVAVTAVAFYLCYLVAQPFLVPLIWALALAVLVFPFYESIERYIKRPNIAAALATLFVAIVIVGPIVLLTREVANEIWQNAEVVSSQLQSGEWHQPFTQNEMVAGATGWIRERVDLADPISQLTGMIPEIATLFLSSSLWIVFQLFITFFALFFFFRDHEEILKSVRRLIPLTAEETDSIFERIDDTLHATVFGEVFIAFLQGAMGAFAFWLTGIPGAIFWGFVMAILGFLPAIGTWMVWLPAAIYLMSQGSWGWGIFLIVWGLLIMTGLTTLIYPKLVGNRLHLHTLLVFVAILGGVFAFGTVGIIVGPAAVAISLSLIDIWKKRIGHMDEDATAET